MSQVKATRRSPRGERSRRTILQAAATEFAAMGFRAASLAVIAERSGITQSGLLHHYPSKEKLLEAVIADQFRVDAELLDRSQTKELPIPVGGYLSLLNRIDDEPSWIKLYTVLVAEGASTDHPAHETFRQRFEQVRARMRTRLELQVANGVLSPDVDLEALVTLVIAAMDGLQVLRLYDREVDVASALQLLGSLAVPAGAQFLETPGNRQR